jgi:triacylglycerol lipase
MLRLAILSTILSGCVIGFDGPNDDFDPVVPVDEEEDPELQPGKAAFVLAHGFGGNAESFDPAIVAAIEADGHLVLRAQVPGVESVAVRAAALGTQIDALLASSGATEVHVIAHSMGGLDARHAISTLGFAPKVASLTTISTPHRGTPLADLALGITTSTTVSQEDALEAIADLLGMPVDFDALDRALRDLAETNAPLFNAATPDAAGVAYLSYAGFSTPNAISNPNAAAACGAAAVAPDSTRAALLLAAPIVARGTERQPNDGVVSIASGTWTGFAGCIPADHLDETAAPTEAFDTAAFYRALAGKLAAP